MDQFGLLVERGRGGDSIVNDYQAPFSQLRCLKNVKDRRTNCWIHLRSENKAYNYTTSTFAPCWAGAMMQIELL